MTSGLRRHENRRPLFALMIVISGAPLLAHAEELLTVREVVFDQPGEHWWERPKDVRFVRVLACGGGGGGGGSVAGGRFVPPQTRSGGGGGAGAEIHEVIFGPLEGTRYQIIVGAGGKGGASLVVRDANPRSVSGMPGGLGGSTAFKGDDATYTARGGTAGNPSVGNWENVMGGTHFVRVAATRVGTVHEAHGGGANEPGGHTPYADGGENDKAVAAGGGGAGLGPGGDAGAANSDGAAGGRCAGGGGAGEPTEPASQTAGGDGGAGYVMLVPLVSSDAVEARVRVLLDTFDE